MKNKQDHFEILRKLQKKTIFKSERTRDGVRI